MIKGLPTDLETFVRQEIAKGKYQSEEDLVAQAVRLLRDHESGKAVPQPKSNEGMDQSVRTPDDIVSDIDQALARGKAELARQLAMEGAERYPNHDELRKCARVLAPPKVTHVGRVQTPSTRASRDWFKAHWKDYIGQWVAVRDGHLVHASPSFDDLASHIDDPQEMLVTKVH
jgi:Arc/MetJ-type ribon-helix-helix transcriptional regulator